MRADWHQASRPPWLKICGFTVAEEACQAAAMGVDAIGFVFAPSPRQITPQHATTISSRIPPGVDRVGVFVDASLGEMLQAAERAGLDTIQLHGHEPPAIAGALCAAGLKVIRAFPLCRSRALEEIRAYGEYGVERFLLDTYVPGRAGGTGVAGDWRLAARVARDCRVILAGGLTPGNVNQAIRQVRPWGVDVSSGVEVSPGRKCPAKAREFVRQARAGAAPGQAVELPNG